MVIESCDDKALYSACLDLGICTPHPGACSASEAHSQPKQASGEPLAFGERVFPSSNALPTLEMMACQDGGGGVHVGGWRGPCAREMTFSLPGGDHRFRKCLVENSHRVI